MGRWNERPGAGIIPVEKSILVLPMMFHQATVEKLRNMKFDSGLERALIETPAIRLGLHERVLEFANLSLQSLFWAHSLGWITFAQSCTIQTGSTGLPVSVRVGLAATVKAKVQAAGRLGMWFQQYDSPVLFRLLGILL